MKCNLLLFDLNFDWLMENLNCNPLNANTNSSNSNVLNFGNSMNFNLSPTIEKKAFNYKNPSKLGASNERLNQLTNKFKKSNTISNNNTINLELIKQTKYLLSILELILDSDMLVTS